MKVNKHAQLLTKKKTTTQSNDKVFKSLLPTLIFCSEHLSFSESGHKLRHAF